MAENQYHEYKEDRNGPAETLTAHVVPAPRRRRIISRRAIVRPTEVRADYAEFKATISAAVEDIKLEIRSQHDQTRTEVQTARRDILSAIQASPAGFIKLVCEFGALLFGFCLALRFVVKIELVNPVFAVFMLFALGLYWTMAHVKQQSEKHRNDKI
jgi:hypothetical protein